jgi:cellulose synthase (UDP-forming)
MASHALQRLRWARGTLQAFFIKSNPLTIPGLSPIQRLAHLEGLLHWFTSISRVGYLLMPLAYSFLGIIPLRATAAELMYFFLPYYLVQLTVFSWLNYRSRSAVLSDIYSLALCFPLALTVVQVMLNPFAKGFKVTPKGTASDRFSFNWSLAAPLILLFGATAVSLWVNLGMCMIKGAWQQTVDPAIAEQAKGIGLGWLWSLYNLLMLGIALLILLDVPRPSPYEWFDLRRTVKLTIAEQTFWGVTTMLSEVGAEVALTQAGFPSLVPDAPLSVQLQLLEDDLVLTGQVTRQGISDEFSTVRILFESISLEQQRHLVEILFCRPGQWKTRQTPGEFQSVWLLFRALLKPRVLFDRNADVNPVAVTQG